MANPIVFTPFMPTGAPALPGDFTQATSEVPANTENNIAADYASRLWNNARPVVSQEEHFYLVAKRIDPTSVALRISEHGELLIPLFSAEHGEFANLQKILPDGTQYLVGDGHANGCYALLPGTGGRIFCMDLATGWTVWQATGRSVLVCLNATNITTVIAGLGVQPGDCIAVDNDNHAQAGCQLNERLDDYGMSHRSAMATGLAFYMSPEPGASFNDVGIEATARVFARAPVSSVPVFDAGKLPSAELQENKSEDLFKALRYQTRPEQAARIAYTLAERFSSQAPVRTSLQIIRQSIEASLLPGVTHPATLDGIMQRLGQALTHRREAALAPITMPEHLTRRHYYERHSQLPPLNPADCRGVIIVKAPMASGKTQRMGRPFAAWADEVGERFLALCHRVSLTSELAERLQLSHYQTIEASTAGMTSGLAICLPSITLPRLAPFIDRVGAVFIDEIAQVLRFLEADSYCRTSWANNEDVYHRLRQIIKRAKCVIVADAGMDARTIEFLEMCRPGEQFRIIEVPEPQDAGIHATYSEGSQAPELAIGYGLAELTGGGKIWIATESRKRTKVLEAFFKQAGYRTLAVHSDNKGDKAQKKFLNDAERESLCYDVVIASPVIGSGLSIEHRDVPCDQRFTLGLYIGGGHSTPPADAAQQLRRVRYLRRFFLALLPNPAATGNQAPAAILSAAEHAARLEGQVRKPTEFDELVADIRSSDTNARADFAAGLLWQLDAAGWTLSADKRSADKSLTKQLKATTRQVNAAYRAALIAAPILSPDEADRLDQLRDRNYMQNLMLEAHQIRRGLGLVGRPLNEDIIEFWDEGRVEAQLDLFGALRGIVPETDNNASPITSGRYWVACAKAYAWLLEGALLEDLVITVDIAETILDRIMQHRHLLAGLGIVDRKYAEWRESKSGKLRPMTRPGYPVREVNDMLRQLGLEIDSERRRCDTSALSPLENGSACVTPGSRSKSGRARGNPIVRHYRPTPASITTMAHWMEQRNKARRTKIVGGGEKFDLESFSALSGGIPPTKGDSHKPMDSA